MIPIMLPSFYLLKERNEFEKLYTKLLRVFNSWWLELEITVHLLLNTLYILFLVLYALEDV